MVGIQERGNLGEFNKGSSYKDGGQVKGYAEVPQG